MSGLLTHSLLAHSAAALPQAAQAFLGGLLASMAVLGVLAVGKLRHSHLVLTCGYTMAATMAWLAFSGLASAFLGPAQGRWVFMLGLLALGLSLAVAGRIPFGRLVGPTVIRPMNRWLVASTSVAMALALLPWIACGLAGAGLLGTVLPWLAILTLTRMTQQSDRLHTRLEARNAQLSQELAERDVSRHAMEAANREIQRAMDQLEQAASVDRLTGAWNRRRFEESAQAEMALAQRSQQALSLIMFDLDHFKRVNDTHGHGTGDMVLVATAQTVLGQLRASDSLVRWGGEEFLVLAPATSQEGALALAEKLRAAVEAVAYPDVGQVTISLGVTAYAAGEPLHQWVQRADGAMYQAKAWGRNRAVSAQAPVSPTLAPRPLVEVVWDDAFTSGHPLIDRQHQMLFRLTSSLLAALTEGQPQDEIALKLQSLIAHSAQHFMDEEALLKLSGYADLAQHAAIHAELLDRARSLHEQVLTGRLDFGVLVGYLAKDLVRGHLLTEDRNYFSALLKEA